MPAHWRQPAAGTASAGMGGEYVSTVAHKSDLDAPDDWHWDVLSWHYGMMVSEGTVRIGKGATMPVRYAQTQARRLFLGALYRLAPHVSAELLQCEPIDVRTPSGEPAALWAACSGADWNNPESVMAREAAKELVVTCRFVAMREHIYTWQERHHLEDSWVARAAHETIMAAYLSFGYPDHPEVVTEWLPAGLPLMLSAHDRVAGVHDGKAWDPSGPLPDEFKYGSSGGGLTPPPGAFMYIPEHLHVHQSVYLNHLKNPDIVLDDGVLEDDGLLAMFDPRTETVDDAVQRLMPKLETRLRRALEGIAAADRKLNDAYPPITFRSATAFEWLVRYQVLGESKRAIAKADETDHSHVAREVNRIAALIGMTLRESKGGRPPLKNKMNQEPLR